VLPVQENSFLSMILVIAFVPWCFLWISTFFLTYVPVLFWVAFGTVNSKQNKQSSFYTFSLAIVQVSNTICVAESKTWAGNLKKIWRSSKKHCTWMSTTFQDSLIGHFMTDSKHQIIPRVFFICPIGRWLFALWPWFWTLSLFGSILLLRTIIKNTLLQWSKSKTYSGFSKFLLLNAMKEK